MEIEHVHIERKAVERGKRKGQGLNASTEFKLSTGIYPVESPSPC